ncbi:MAG TPA: hypothetical protein PL182_09610 [Pseudobdellovibrionaceae bacterium]|nr:hypothetical protein [Pseudobdellovibrionaceae bacterium]
MTRPSSTQPGFSVTLFLSAICASFLLGACAHSEKRSEVSFAKPDRNVFSISSFERESEVVVPEETPTRVKHARVAPIAQNSNTAPGVAVEEPSRDIASVPEVPTPLRQAEHRWLPWMTIALGLLLAFALAASVRSIKKGPRP